MNRQLLNSIYHLIGELEIARMYGIKQQNFQAIQALKSAHSKLGNLIAECEKPPVEDQKSKAAGES